MNKNIWRDPVWSAVIAAAITGGATYFFGFWPTIWRFIKSIPSFLITTLPIPIWTLLFAVPFLLFIIPLINSLRSAREPRFLSYTNDELFEINWYWRWLAPDRFNSSYRLIDLTPRCPLCHAVLSINNYGSSLVTCMNEGCNWQWKRQQQHGSRINHSTELDSKVHNEIDRRIHAGERG